MILDLGDEYWLESEGPVDPYLRWAAATDFRNLGRPRVSRLSFIVERTESSEGWAALRRLPGVTVPLAYDEDLPNKAISRFATVRIDIEDDLEPDEITLRVLALLTHPDAERLQLGYPRGKEDGPLQLPGPIPPPPPPIKLEVDVLIGIIDDGCPFAHPDLCGADGKPRLELLWQQTVLDGPRGHWRRVAKFDNGRVLDRAGMAKYMVESSPQGEVDELQCYLNAFATTDLGYEKASRVMLARASHGGSVMAVAAGVPASLSGQRLDDAHDDLHGTAGDAASKAPLIFVDLPREQVEISSGRWISINAIDGLRFIQREARARFQGPSEGPVPIVVNLSSGSTAGSHVGEAMLERAMDELLGADPQLAITLATGNSRTSESHARLDVPAGGSALIGVFLPPMHRFDTFVEFWLPAGQTQPDVTVSVLSPDGIELKVSKSHREAFVGDSPDERSAALLFYPRVVQAKGRTMVLLALSGTTTSVNRNAPSAWPVNAPGPWRVTVRNAGATKLTVQAWIERDEVVFGTRRDQAARFFAMDGCEPEGDAGVVRETNTMSNISTGQHAFAVGAYRGPTEGGPVAEYSGAPSEEWAAHKRYLPFAAKADVGRSHPGVRVPGNRGNVLRRMNGTSVAAPQAARFVANEMAKGQTRDQIEKALPEQPKPLPEQGGASRVDPADGRRRL